MDKMNSSHKYNKARILFLGILSLFFVPFAPVLLMGCVPLIVIGLSSKKKSFFLVSGISLLTLVGLTYAGVQSFAMAGVYFLMSVLSYLIIESFYRGLDPRKTFMVLGLVFSFLTLGVYEYAKVNGYSLEKELGKIESLQAQQIVGIDKDKKKEEFKKEMSVFKERARFADQFSAPLIFSLIFVNIWMIFYFTLSSYHFYTPLNLIKYSESYFLNTKMPYVLIWTLIGCLSLYLADGEFFNFEEIHRNLILSVMLFCGSLFFIQGLSVILSLMNRFSIYGFIRSLLLILTVFMFSYMIVLVGILDFWGDFRNKFKEKLNKV